MDTIHLQRLDFFGYHGVLAEEQTLGQHFIVDLELGADLSAAGKSDDYKDTVCYASVFKAVQTLVETEKFKLIEALGEAICQKILLDFSRVQTIRVKISKPQAPIQGHFESVGIELYRER